MSGLDREREELLEIADRLEAWASQFQLSRQATREIAEPLMKREGAPSHSLPHAEVVADCVRLLRRLAAEPPLS